MVVLLVEMEKMKKKKGKPLNHQYKKFRYNIKLKIK